MNTMGRRGFVRFNSAASAVLSTVLLVTSAQS